MRSYIPYGVSPAVLLPFDNDLAIDEAAFRKHLRDVAATDGISAITINAHSTEVASCTFDEQRKVLDIARDEIGARLPLVNGIWADGSLEAARIARMATAGGASALLVFPPAPFTLRQSPQMALAHFSRIAEASDLSIIVFQYPIASGQGYPPDTLLRMCEEIPTIREPTAARMARAHAAKPATSGQRALDPQRLAVELARARLQRTALRQRQRDSGSAIGAFPCGPQQ
jgi:4-hydroxy-tetrahydrodipicolinate synthase